MSFESLGLTPALLQALQTMGLVHPTPIQSRAIGPALQGRDVYARAQTGSGKTLAYTLPLLQGLPSRSAHGPRRTRAVVLVPTRELAVQAAQVLAQLTVHLQDPPRIQALYGGVSVNPQMMALRGGADLVVATPGRLLDLVRRNALRLTDVGTLVLDEADRLLDPGFADELEQVLTLLPTRRQTLLFSATYPDTVRTLASQQLHDPVEIETTETLDHPLAIAKRALRVDTGRRTQLLRHLMRQENWSRALVFVATRYATEHVAAKLYQNGIRAVAFHGDLSQGARRQVLEQFKAGQWSVMVTTDLAARGIDIAQLPVVVNYDLPRSTTDHVHRVGRTGRAGAAGLAVSFVTPPSEAHWRLIAKREHLDLPLEVVPGFEPTETAPTAPGTGGVKGRRPSKKDKLRAANAARAADNPQAPQQKPQP